MKSSTVQKIKRQAGKIPFAADFYHSIKGAWHYSSFVGDFFRFKRMSGPDPRFPVLWSRQFPCLNDKTSATGFEPHYLYHPAWAARILASTRPKLHIDFSSILHFSTLVSAFVPVDFYDYRPADIRLPNLRAKRGDLLAMPFPNDSVESLSCMHTVEHVGLGRYGDPLDPDGDLKAIKELKRVLAPGGALIFVVPMGKPRLEYNAHRIYSYSQIMSYFSEMELVEFSLIPDNAAEAGIIMNAKKEDADRQEWACGCFWLSKRR